MTQLSEVKEACPEGKVTSLNAVNKLLRLKNETKAVKSC